MLTVRTAAECLTSVIGGALLGALAMCLWAAFADNPPVLAGLASVYASAIASGKVLYS